MDLNHLIRIKTPKISHFLLIMLFIIQPISSLSAKTTEIENSHIKQVMLQSKITHQSYALSIYTPNQPVPKEGFPILYLLDGHLTFPLTQKIADNLINENQIKPIIIVGIDYTDQSQWINLRAQDYTPPHNTTITNDPFIKGEANGGGAPLFLSFINKELKPFIEQNFHVNQKQQAIFGHSYGGLFTLYTRFTQPDSFQYYYAASPSIWWDNKVIMQTVDQFMRNTIPSSSTPKFIISVGSLEQTAPDNSPNERKQKLIKRKQVSNATVLANLLNSATPDKLLTAFIIFPNQNHGTVIPLAIEQALMHFFKKSH